MRFCLAAILFVMMSAPASAAEEIDQLRCPDAQQGQALKDLDFYEGPPENRDGLMPEDDGWNLQSYHNDGQKLYLVCHYDNLETPVQYEIPGNLDFCTRAGINVDCR